MVSVCCAIKCKNKASKDSTLSFHKIPVDPERRKKWIHAIRRIDPVTKKPWEPSRHSTICSKHFIESDFYLSKHAGFKLLKESAVPSQFEWTKKQHNKRESNVSKKALLVIEKKETPKSDHQILNKFIQREHQYCVGQTEEQIKRKFHELREQLEMTQHELEISKRKEKRCRDNLAKMRAEMKELKKRIGRSAKMQKRFTLTLNQSPT